MKQVITIILATICALAFHAKEVAKFTFDLNDDKICESMSGGQYKVNGNFTPENVKGAVGNALRFDGYSTYVNAAVGDILTDAMASTFSVWVAVEAYPIIEVDVHSTERVPIVDCLNKASGSGFAFSLGMDGKVDFSTYIGGWIYTLESSDLLPTGEWVNLTVTLDKENRKGKFYMNGNLVAESRCNGTVSVKSNDMVIGHSRPDRFMGPFRLTAFSCMIDDLTIWDEVKSQEEIASWSPENEADFTVPDSRFEDDLLRPRFHAMPQANWTNECHGMTYSDGRYHIFFQKNANGPYMARLHWGHISSENLYDWREEKIAIAPGESYDFKGCWSGCVFSDEVLSQGKPMAIYTAVDYGRAVIAAASPVDDALIKWSKHGIWINGRPGGLSDDFRDPYFFRNGDKAYIIVGSSKDGVGTTTLHKYNPDNNSWSNDGSLFFTGKNAAQYGSFWEMPNVTDMGDGRFLFTVTPLGTSTGVHTLYMTGTVNSEDRFEPNSNFAAPKNVELISRDGYGLLSPTIYKHNGKTIALGIVPDKLSSERNSMLGWAHTYSLPREWNLDENGELIQKPYEGLTGLRSNVNFSKSSFDLNGDLPLDPVSGRQVELLARFTIGSFPVGFKFFKNDIGEAKISYHPLTGELKVDFSELNRWVNDGGVYNGVYKCALPSYLSAGSELKLNLFIDGSIVDIFVNDRWATSIRVFPTDEDADHVEVFSDGGSTFVNEVMAWNLDCSQSGVVIPTLSDDMDSNNNSVDVFNLMGACVKKKVPVKEALKGLNSGIYIIGNKKYIVK